MTEQKQTPPDDHELEQFLARRSELSQRYHSDLGSAVGSDAAGEGAPPELDAAVLARARAESQRPAASSRRFLRWGRPLAVAASLMLVVSLGWMAQQKPLPQEVAQTAAPPVVPKEVAVPAMEAIPAPPVARKAEEAERRKTLAKATPPVQSLQPSPAPAGDALVRRQAEVQAPVASLPAPPPEEPPPPRPMSAPAQVQQAAPMSVVKPAAPERSRDEAYAFKRESRSALAASSAGAAAESAAAPAASVAANASPAPLSFAAAPPPPEMAAPVSSAPAANSATALNPCASSPVHAAALGQVQVARGADAATWLQQIRRLRDASDLDGARAELACFSYTHAPGDVPEDLKALLQPAP